MHLSIPKLAYADRVRWGDGDATCIGYTHGTDVTINNQ